MIEIPFSAMNTGKAYEILMPWAGWVSYIYHEHGLPGSNVLPEMSFEDDIFDCVRRYRFYFKYVREFE